MKVKKAILTGGGRATRLYPITATTNKHLLPLANKPMILHAIEKAVAAGVREIYINTNPGDRELSAAIGNGDRWGVSITFFEQTGGPQGIAHVVKEAERFIGRNPFLFYLSDNILLGGIVEMMEEFDREGYDCMLAFASVSDPERFGVPYFDERGKLIRVVEKPNAPPDHLAVTGVYVYGPNIFFDAFGKIKKSVRGEYEISDVHSVLLAEGKRVGYKEITGWWKDTGKPEDLLAANRLLLDEMKGASDGVSIAVGCQIGADVELCGPVVIGSGCAISDSVIGPYATIGSGASIRGIKMRDSMALNDAHIEGPLTIEGSLIGNGVSIRVNGESSRVCKMIVGDKTVLELS